MRSVLIFLPLLACSAKTLDSADTSAVDSGPGDSGDAVPPGIQWFSGLIPMDLTPDGRTMLAQDATSLAGDVLLVRTADGVSILATSLGDASKDMATGISIDERFSALHGVPVEAGVWSATAGWTDLPSPYATDCDPDRGGAFDISDDGAVVVGLMWDGCAPVAFRWTEAGGVQPLELLGEPAPGSPSHPTNRATVVSGDGRWAAGFASSGSLDRTPALWGADGVGELLDPEARDAPGEVLSISYDGGTQAGLRGNDGFVRTRDGGFVDLGRVDTALPSDPVYPNAMTADGQVVFGAVGSEFFGVPVAFVWTEGEGMQALQPLVEAAGVPIEAGWTLTNVMAVSDDGRVLVGRGFDPDYAAQAFVLRLPDSVGF